MNEYIEFEILNSKKLDQPYYWHIRSRKNYKVLAASETLTTTQACLDAIKLVKANAATAPVWDMTGEKPKLVA